MRDVEDTAETILPDTVTGSFTGTAQDFQSSVVSMILLIIVALVLIYIVLGILYESFIHPSPFCPACLRRDSAPCSCSGYSISNWT